MALFCFLNRVRESAAARPLRFWHKTSATLIKQMTPNIKDPFLHYFHYWKVSLDGFTKQNTVKVYLPFIGETSYMGSPLYVQCYISIMFIYQTLYLTTMSLMCREYLIKFLLWGNMLHHSLLVRCILNSQKSKAELQKGLHYNVFSGPLLGRDDRGVAEHVAQK